MPGSEGAARICPKKSPPKRGLWESYFLQGRKYRENARSESANFEGRHSGSRGATSSAGPFCLLPRKPERGYIRMFPRNEKRNEGTFACSPGTKTGTGVRLLKPPFYETTLLSRSDFWRFSPILYFGHPKTCVYPDVCLGIAPVSGKAPLPGLWCTSNFSIRLGGSNRIQVKRVQKGGSKRVGVSGVWSGFQVHMSKSLQFPNAVALNAVGFANERKCKSAKRAQKSSCKKPPVLLNKCLNNQVSLIFLSSVFG